MEEEGLSKNELGLKVQLLETFLGFKGPRRARRKLTSEQVLYPEFQMHSIIQMSVSTTFTKSS